MIRGTVNDDLEPRIQILLSSFDDQETRISAVLDTGFAGHLTVPPRLIKQLRLPTLGPTNAILADGSPVELEQHLAIVTWNGRKRPVIVLAADENPLVGTQLLKDHSLHIEMSPGGNVIIRPRRSR